MLRIHYISWKLPIWLIVFLWFYTSIVGSRVTLEDGIATCLNLLFQWLCSALLLCLGIASWQAAQGGHTAKSLICLYSISCPHLNCCTNVLCFFSRYNAWAYFLFSTYCCSSQSVGLASNAESWLMLCYVQVLIRWINNSDYMEGLISSAWYGNGLIMQTVTRYFMDKGSA